MNVAFSAASNSAEIRSRRCGRCYICGTDGKWLHKNVVDHYFGAPGIWSFRRCANHECRLIWLDPMPLEEDIGIAYKDYLTHEDYSAPKSWHGLSALPELIRNAYRANRYGVGPKPRMSALLGLPIYLTPRAARRLISRCAISRIVPRAGCSTSDAATGRCSNRR